MARRAGRGKNLQLNTIPISPMALVKGYVSSVTTQVRSTVDMVQRVASSVKSVEIVSDQVKVNLEPEKIEPGAMVRLQMGQQNLGLRGDFNVSQEGQEVFLTLKLDAFLLDHMMGRKVGGLVSQAACRFNTKIRIVMHDTFDADAIAPPARKRLGKK